MAAPPFIRVQCHVCAGETKHEVRHEDVERREWPETGEWLQEVYQLICCGGCGARSLRRITTSDIPSADKIELYPPRTTRKKPKWIADLVGINDALKELLDEVYVPLEGGAKRLTVMGARSVLEHIMVEHVGDSGTFEANIDAFHAQGHIGDAQRDVVKTVIDVGSAAIHRGYRPSDADLEATMDVMESVVKSIYIDKPAVQRIKLPPRPPRKTTSQPVGAQASRSGAVVATAPAAQPAAPASGTP